VTVDELGQAHEALAKAKFSVSGTRTLAGFDRMTGEHVGVLDLEMELQE